MAEEKLARVRDTLGSFPDFPKQGVLFRDIFPVLRDPAVFNDVIDLLYDAIKESCPGAQCIVGLESRGFLLAPILAQRLGIPFVPIRKKGKLPGDLASVTYQLEYGSDTFEAQKGSIGQGQKVVVVDDLLATGGTLKAACDLVEQIGAQVDLCLVIIELADLEGRKKITKPLKSLITFSD